MATDHTPTTRTGRAGCCCSAQPSASRCTATNRSSSSRSSNSETAGTSAALRHRRVPDRLLMRTAAAVTVAAVAAAVLCCSQLAAGRIVEGTISQSGFKFLSKFCFDQVPLDVATAVSAGTRPAEDGAQWKFERLSGPAMQAIVVFYDNVDFDALYQRHLACGAYINSSDATVLGANADSISRVITQVSRPRFWFTSVANCDKQFDFNTSPVKYRLTMLNPGGFFKRQFSKDEQGQAETYIAFTGLYIVLILSVSVALRKTSKTPQLSRGLKAVSVLMLVRLCSLGLNTADYLLIAASGVGFGSYTLVAQGLELLQELGFMFLLIVMMHGWSTSFVSLPRNSIICNVALALALLGATIAVFVLQATTSLASSSISFYESSLGLGLVGIRCVAGFWFLISARMRMLASISSNRRTFVVTFTMLGTGWFLVLPLVVGAAALLNPWVRSKVVVIVSLAINFIAYCAVAFVLRPSNIERVFNAMTTVRVLTTRAVPSNHADPDPREYQLVSLPSSDSNKPTMAPRGSSADSADADVDRTGKVSVSTAGTPQAITSARSSFSGRPSSNMSTRSGAWNNEDTSKTGGVADADGRVSSVARLPPLSRRQQLPPLQHRQADVGRPPSVSPGRALGIRAVISDADDEADPGLPSPEHLPMSLGAGRSIPMTPDTTATAPPKAFPSVRLHGE